MEKWICDVCGYEYDPAENDGVAFEDLPADWVCPLCGVGKDQFELEIITPKTQDKTSKPKTKSEKTPKKNKENK